MQGVPVDPNTASVSYDDDGFFILPDPVVRQLISFLRPGFDRTSAFPAFAGPLINKPDKHMTTSLRGEPRPCITCGMCEKVCPVRLLPQVLHRYLHKDMEEEAEKAGLYACVDCNLCSFVCPSKIELQAQFDEARTRIADERREHEVAE